MPTIDELCSLGSIEKVQPEDVLEADQLAFRRIYMSPKLSNWLRDALPGIRTDGYIRGALTPAEQVLTAFQDFISGRSPESFEMAPNQIKPRQLGVWELRTPDIRIFGVFPRSDTFLGCSACTKRQAMRNKNQGYAHHRDATLLFVNGLDLDPPKIKLGDLRDVITV